MSEEPGEHSKITLTPWQLGVSAYFRAMIPGLLIESNEEQRVLGEIKSITQYLAQNKCGQREFFTWSDCSYKQYNLFRKPGDLTEQVEVIDMGSREFFLTLQEFAKADSKEESSNRSMHKSKVLVLLDPHAALESPTNCRVLKETLQEIKGHRKTIILIGNNIKIPAMLNELVKYIKFELPSSEDLQKVIQPILDSYKSTKGFEKVKIEDKYIKPFVRGGAGLTELQVREALSLSLAKYTAFDSRAVDKILEEKTNEVKKNQVLTVKTPQGGLDLIGGNKYFKEWVKKISNIILNPEKAKAYGVKIPSACCLMGVSGTGKSLGSEILASAWNVPLFCLDMGAVFGMYVGESEAKLRNVITLINANSPCVVRIDEVEKGLSSGSNAHETTRRVISTLLTWLEEKPEGVFVVATANDIRALEQMPELIQRFTQTFFVDLPNEEARVEILKIHVKLSGHTIPENLYRDIAKITYGFSGRELRNVVNAALTEAFTADLKSPGIKEFAIASKLITPTYKSMKNKIDELRAWCKQDRAKPAGDLLEDDKVEIHNIGVDLVK